MGFKSINLSHSLRFSNSCHYNCKEKVVTSHRFALKALCSVSKCRLGSADISWKLYKKGIESNESVTVWHLNESLGSLISTKTNSKNIVFDEETLHGNSSYWLTVDIKSLNGTRGWAGYRFETAATPSGGTCYCTQLAKGTLGISLNISCAGWKDEHKPLVFEFYHVHMLDDGTSPHMLSHSIIPFSEVQLPEFSPGEIAIKAVVINSLGARAETYLSINVSISFRA